MNVLMDKQPINKYIFTLGQRKDDRQVESLFKVFLSFGEVAERQFPWQQLSHKLLWNAVNLSTRRIGNVFFFIWFAFQKYLITDHYHICQISSPIAQLFRDSE